MRQKNLSIRQKIGDKKKFVNATKKNNFKNLLKFFCKKNKGSANSGISSRFLWLLCLIMQSFFGLSFSCTLNYFIWEK